LPREKAEAANLRFSDPAQSFIHCAQLKSVVSATKSATQ